MQKSAALFALAALALSLAACNRANERRIGFIPKGRTHLFWQSVHAGAVAASRGNAGFGVVWNGPASETDFEGQIQIVDSMINQHLDAICLAPIDRKVLVNIVNRASSAGVPVIIFDSPVDTDQFVAQVATDNYAAGQLAATRVADILGGNGRIAEVAVEPGSASTMAREKGFEDKIASIAPGIKIADKQYGMADFAQSLKVSENMLTAAPDLKGMFASNESSTVGALRALKGRTGVKLVGFDFSPQILEGLKDGTIDSVVVQDPFQMGFKSFVAAVTKLKGGTPERIQDITPALVTKANVDNPEIQRRINPDLDKYLK
jgi:ribose transport system substrate-binding protein